MATYVEFDKLKYDFEIFNHRYVYDIPYQENDNYLEYCTLKSKKYKDITSEDRQRIQDLTNELYDYIFFADDINNYATAVINMQKFISGTLPDYINDLISKMWAEINKMIKQGQDLFDAIKAYLELYLNNLHDLVVFDWDNDLAWSNVDATSWTPTHSTKSFNGFEFATKDIEYKTINNVKHCITHYVVKELVNQTVIIDKTFDTYKKDGAIKRKITNNLI